MYKVMIVDDMDVVRRQIKRLNLWGEETGFIIHEEADDGYNALMKLKNNHMNLVITDIRMPKVDGLELLRKITENNLADCVVFLSDYMEFDYAREGLKHGAFDYIMKPVKVEELKLVLNKAYKFIFGMQQQSKIIKQLEDKLIEKVEVFYPSALADNVMEYISNGDSRVLDTAEKLVDTTAEAYSNDVIKTAIIIQKVLHGIREAIERNFPWIVRYIDLKEVFYVDFTRLSDITSIKNNIIGCVKILTENIKKYEPCGNTNNLVSQVCRYVLDNVENKVSISAVSEALYVTKSHISETFKQKTGITLGEYITMVKIERAKMLLAEGNLKNYEIADTLDFSDVDYFGKLFKKCEGITPTEYRKAK